MYLAVVDGDNTQCTEHTTVLRTCVYHSTSTTTSSCCTAKRKDGVRVEQHRGELDMAHWFRNTHPNCYYSTFKVATTIATTTMGFDN